MKQALFALLIGVLHSAVALAQPPAGPEGPPRGEGRGGPGGPGGFLRMLPLMIALDTDGDGEISPKEIKRAIVALKTLDKDGNGRLTEDELRPEFPGGPGGPDGPGGPAGPGGRQGGPGGPANAESFVSRAMEFDEDMDGKLSRVELMKMAQQLGRRGPQADGGAAPGGRSRPPRPDTKQ
jgi:hypothetical protein